MKKLYEAPSVELLEVQANAFCFGGISIGGNGIMMDDTLGTETQDNLSNSYSEKAW